MEDLEDVRLEQLTAEMAWIRGLARVLVQDASVADDVAQEAWLAAAGKVPDDRPLRPWLSRVVTNVVRMRLRSSRRREAREAAAPQADPSPAADELVDRLELQRAVVDEVLALHEPYRSTVLLHFFEGLSSAELARRLGVPDGTVRRRLKVAVDVLRERLRERHRHRGGLLALAPLLGARPPVASALLTAGELAMKKILIVAAALVLVLGSVWLWRGRGGRSPAGGPAPAAATAGGAAV
ncbi:MAG TPA: RNA polymerase sigma factor, partial [Kofleriaceae bacterium]|nr:RNA polymerase sigma factor [Kofleriaceae bacterium]